MIVDAHAHIDLDRPGILTVLCGTEPLSAERVLSMRAENVIASCALHPWYAARHSVEDMLPYIEKSPILGEIGLDSVWTDVPMVHQYKAFREQLEIAARLNKPIVLHTKGMEREIAREIRPYSVRKLVHWYSCEDFLDDYLEQDCWFTVGPDHENNPAVQQVIRRAPLNRLLTETDGLSAVEWALGRSVQPGEIESVLRGELNAIAQAKGITADEAEKAVYRNLMEFINGEKEAPF